MTDVRKSYQWLDKPGIKTAQRKRHGSTEVGSQVQNQQRPQSQHQEGLQAMVFLKETPDTVYHTLQQAGR